MRPRHLFTLAAVTALLAVPVQAQAAAPARSYQVAPWGNDKAHGSIPSLVHMHPDETVGQAIEVLREYGVSQMPIVKPGAGHPDVMAAEVVGSVVERELLDALFTKRASLDDPLEKHMSAPLPQVGSGEPVGDLMSVLGAADAAIVLVEGKPTGVVSRQDLLAFLAKGGK